MTITARICAACGNATKTVLYRQPLVLPENSGGQVPYGGYDLAQCDKCGFVYADNTTSQEAADDHYAGATKVAQDLTNLGEPDADILRIDSTLDLLKSLLRHDDSILDVGCGTGRLIALLKEEGYEHCSGIDQSPAAVAIARAKYGVDVTLGSIFSSPTRGYDFITACHVLEHIVDLPGFVLRLQSLLNRDGRLYIEAPDVHQLARFADPRESGEWIYIRDLMTHFAPEHVNFFSTTSLRNLMRRFGFEEIYCASEPLGVVASCWQRHGMEEFDALSRQSLLEYARASHSIQSSALRIIRDISRSRQEVLIWGAGLHTQRLLGSGEMDGMKIRAFIDSDPNLHGASLRGIPIYAPEQISDLNLACPIVVSSWKGQRSILQAIDDRALKNARIILYPDLLDE